MTPFDRLREALELYDDTSGCDPRLPERRSDVIQAARSLVASDEFGELEQLTKARAAMPEQLEAGWPFAVLDGASAPEVDSRLVVVVGRDWVARTITGVAFRLPNGAVHSAPWPSRHGGHLLPEGHPPVSHGDITQGFVLDDGSFVNRFEALQIARTNGQLIRKTQPEDRLFSEDLW